MTGTQDPHKLVWSIFFFFLLLPFFFFFFFYCAGCRLSLVVVHRFLTVVGSLFTEHGVWDVGASVVVARGFSCPTAGGILPDQG